MHAQAEKAGLYMMKAPARLAAFDAKP